MQLEPDQPIIQMMKYRLHLTLDHEVVSQFTVQRCPHILMDGTRLAKNVVLFNYKEN